jgi:hypothetical protein
MKAAVYYETGGPEVFRYEDVPGPQPLDLAQRFGDAVQLDLGGEGWGGLYQAQGRRFDPGHPLSRSTAGLAEALGEFPLNRTSFTLAGSESRGIQ